MTTAQGHKPAGRPADAFSLDDSEFQAALANAASGEVADDGDTPTEETPGQNPAAADDAGDTGPEPNDADGTQTPDQEQEADAPLVLDDEPAAEPADDAGDTAELVEIVHRGLTYRLTPDEVRALAQKGFDYDTKVKELAGGRRLLQVIEADPTLAKKISDHLNSPGGDEPAPEQKSDGYNIKPIGDYEKADDWLRDNLTDIVTMVQKAAPAAETPEQQVVRNVHAVLTAYDPTNVQRVLPLLADPRFQGRLTLDQVHRIGNDMGAMIKYYDWVKDQVISDRAPAGTNQKPSPNRAGTTPRPAGAGRPSNFRMRSAGGAAPAEENKIDKPWNLSKKDFKAVMDKVKGYSD